MECPPQDVGCVPRTARPAAFTKAAFSKAFETSCSRNFVADVRSFFTDVDFESFIKLGVDFTDSQFCELLVFLIRVVRSNGVFDTALACFDYLRHSFDMRELYARAKFFISYVRNACVEFYDAFVDELAHESTPIADKFGEALGVFSKYASSELFTSLKRLLLSLASIKFFSKDISKEIFRKSGTRPTCEIDAYIDILKSFHTLIASGERLLNGESLGSILSSDDPVANFVSEAKRLITMKDFTYVGLPVEGYIHRTEFASEVEKTLFAGNELVKHMPKNGPAYPSLFALNLRLVAVNNELKNAVYGERRMTPYAIKLVGSPGVGKSTVFDYICRFHSRALGREYSDEYVFHRNIASDYWEGLKPLSQDVIHYSEAGNTAQKIAMATPDPVLQEITSLIDSLPMTANMASLEAKGSTFIAPSMVIADINDANMNASFQVNNPAAFHRRWVTVNVIVKPEFRMDNSMQLDAKKCLEVMHNDFWDFKVTTFRATSARAGHEVVEKEHATLATLRDFLIGHMTDHYASQRKILEKIKSTNIDEFQDAQNESDVSEFVGVLPERFFSVKETFFHGSAALFYFAASWATFLCPSFFLRFFIELIRYRTCASLDHKRSQSYALFWQSLGYETPKIKLFVRDTPTYKAVLYSISALLGAMMLMRAFRSLSRVEGEGAVMSKSSDRDDSEVKDGIVTLENQIGVDKPRSVKYLKPNSDWFQRESLALKYLKNKETTNEPHGIVNRVARNVRYFSVYVEYDGSMKDVTTRGLGVCEDFIILNKHCLLDNSEFRMDQKTADGVTTIRKFTVTDFFPMGTDLILCRVPGDKFVDIRPFLLDPLEIVNSVAGVIGDRVPFDTRVVPHDDTTISFYGRKAHQRDLLSYQWDNHAYGKCGTPVLAQLGRSFGVVGIHSAGDTKSQRGFCQRLHPSLVDEAILTLSKTTPYLRVNSEGDVRLDGLIKEPHKRSPLRYEGTERLRYVGTRPGNVPPSKSNIKRSALFKEATLVAGTGPFDSEGQELYGAPLMKGITVDGRYYDPESNFYRKLDKPGVALHSKRMEKAIFAVVDHIITGLYDRGIDHLAPVDIYTSQNGHCENYYMRSMRNSTSGGYPWPGSKRKLLLEEPREGKPDGKMPKMEVLDHLLYQSGAYARNEDACPLLGAQLKDEPRAAAKNKYAKTRVFMMSPYESTLLQRALLMPFYTLMCEHKDLFCCSIGINMHSTDVDEFVHDLSSFADHYMEGDYGGFDTSMPYEIGLAANTVVYTICAQLGYNEEALRQVKGLLSDNLYPTCVVRGDVIQVPALQPSGKYATAEDNSLRGLLMLVYFYVCQFPERDPCSFFDQVLPRIYGDDLLAAVKPESRHLFNNVVYSQFCEDVYGIEYTNAQKTKDFKPFLSLKETSFLKRTFIFREDIGHWVAPLDKTSIMKSIAYILPSKVVSEEEQTLDSVVSAMREMFFHCSEEDYEKRRVVVARMVEAKYNLPPNEFLRRLPSFWTICRSLFNDDSEIESESRVNEAEGTLVESPAASLGRLCARFVKRAKKAVPYARAAAAHSMDRAFTAQTFSDNVAQMSYAIYGGAIVAITNWGPAMFLLHLFPGCPPILVRAFTVCIWAPINEELWKEYVPVTRFVIGWHEMIHHWAPGHLLFHMETPIQLPDLKERIKYHMYMNTFSFGTSFIPGGWIVSDLHVYCHYMAIFRDALERHGFHL